MRRDFQLQSDDHAFAARLGLPWETVIQGSERWVLIHEHPVGPGYVCERATVAVQMPGGYPDAQLDMVFVFPALVRRDSVPIRATDSTQIIEGKTFQRWSRHRTSDNPWRPGDDNLETHYNLICDWFRREFERVA